MSLPVRPGYEGIGPARLRVHGGPVLAELRSRFGADAAAKVLAGEVLCADGSVVSDVTELPAGAFIYWYRDLPDEVVVPFDVPVLYRDENIVVVDKPHFLATTPRGGHVVQTALVRLRRELGLWELSPAHRLDRLTAGVLVFTARREVRGAYQTMFASGGAAKTYLARSSAGTLDGPVELRNRIVKRRGSLQAVIEPGEVNAVTVVEPLGSGLFQLTPATGRTHQLRVHMNSLGLPIDGDPLYPTVLDVPAGDFSTPLRLLAQRLAFADPVTGEQREFVSARELD
ncbi:pseudouridine synthase [Mycolicibacterium sp. lyk4-40-TYG-92]|uniref:pseudouridine synthase n=1 Tax=Mycolicibacterium sp. lyk4-40-TYG-92 TaxID=3040295 RepID=UPI00254F37AB|nr:pseudouridine synthase [Mycolicibacterium sp. lyk4-40-TYG-92]